MLRAAIFDMDGTLLDSMHVWREVTLGSLRRFGAEPAPDFEQLVRSMTLRESAEYARAVYGVPASAEQIEQSVYDEVREFYRSEVCLKAGAAELLDSLAARGVPFALATATDRPFADMALQRLGLWERFCGIFTCTEIGAGKSRPDIFLTAAARLGAQPEECMVFEDSLDALATAASAGFLTAGVYDPASVGLQKEIAARADVYFPNFDNAMARLEKFLPKA